MLGGPVGVEAGGVGGDTDLDVVAQPARLALVPRPWADRGSLKDSELEWHDRSPLRDGRRRNARHLHAYCLSGVTASVQRRPAVLAARARSPRGALLCTTPR